MTGKELFELLDDWGRLNEFLMQPETTEEACQELLKHELKGRRRRVFLMRVHSAFNKRRYRRERKELEVRRA